jgi:hypothetical protein
MGDMRKFFVMGLLVLLVAGVAMGQDVETPTECPTGAAVFEALASMAGELDTEGMETLAVLDLLRAAISEYTVACTGLNFSSEQDGMQPVIGPVEIPEGIYRVTATTEGGIISKIDVLSGECGGYGGSLVSAPKGQANNGAQVVFESAGCEALVSITLSTDAWTLAFEKLR